MRLVLILLGVAAYVGVGVTFAHLNNNEDEDFMVQGLDVLLWPLLLLLALPAGILFVLGWLSRKVWR